MARQPGGILIAGVSARAFAESAVRAGFGCLAVDAFGDLDLKARVASIGLRRDLGMRYSATAAASVARELEAAAVAYVANFENHPAAVRRLAVGRRLLGNAPGVLARARDPAAFAEIVRAAGERMPRTLRAGELERADPRADWLVKPARGGGGSGVRPWRPGDPVAAHELLQERVRGTSASVVFLADGRHAQVIGMSEQLADEGRFGAPGFRYCGSLYPLSAGAARRRTAALAEALTAALRLKGVNGIDFVLEEEGGIVVLELNPRYPASVELVERATGLSAFAAHLAACEGELAAAPPPPDDTWGKAIVYARQDVLAGNTREWLDRPDIRDLPFPGEHIRAGAPVCSVFARGVDALACCARLQDLAREVEGMLTPASPPAATLELLP